MEALDKKDCQILNLLQEDCRMTLTKISKNIGLSVDATKKRIEKMIEKKIFYPRIQLRPRNFGFNNIVDVQIKLHNYTEKDMETFIEYLIKNPRIAEIFSLSGEWDFSIIVIAKNAQELGSITREIRENFAKIIQEWSEMLTTTTYKFETYDMLELMEYDKRKR